MSKGAIFGKSMSSRAAAAGAVAVLSAVLAAALFTGCERPSDSSGPLGAEPVAIDRPVGGPHLSDVPDTVPPPPPEPVKMEPLVVVNKDAEVSILGYHDFSAGDRGTSEMVMNVDDFREQMQRIKDSKIPVISMREYLAWRRGEQPIPDPCVMITIDDGWKATHTLALPVLKEFGFPFTIFLYKKYVGIGGRSLTHEEIRELMAAGGTVGSHSASHISMINRGGRSDAEYDEWLRVELQESYDFLVENFSKDGEVLKVFAYPFGIYSDYVVEKALSYGYQAAFTVNGSKTYWDTPELAAGRYIVYGRADQNFDPALTFRGGGVLNSGSKLLQASEGDGEAEGDKGPRGPLVTTFPQDGQEITDRRPVIHLDVSKLDGVDAGSIVMRVTGFGEVMHSFDAEAGIIRYQVPMALRTKQCGVTVRFQHAGNTDAEEIGWNFSVDRVGSYLEGVDPALLPGGEKKQAEPAGNSAAVVDAAPIEK